MRSQIKRTPRYLLSPIFIIFACILTMNPNMGLQGACGNQSDWEITGPTRYQSFYEDADIGGFGTGPPSQNFIWAEEYDNVVANSMICSTDEMGQWGCTLSPPAGGWTVGNSNHNRVEINCSGDKDSSDINIDPEP